MTAGRIPCWSCRAKRFRYSSASRIIQGLFFIIAITSNMRMQAWWGITKFRDKTGFMQKDQDSGRLNPDLFASSPMWKISSIANWHTLVGGIVILRQVTKFCLNTWLPRIPNLFRSLRFIMDGVYTFFIVVRCHKNSVIFDTSHLAYENLRHIALWRFNLTR